MQQSRITRKHKQILWRQDQVLKLAADGYSEREIAAQLQISDTTIHRDLTLLKQQAKEQINQYITERMRYKRSAIKQSAIDWRRERKNGCLNITINR